MFSRLLNSESKSVEAAAYVLAGSGIFAGIFGILRDALLASHFGATQDLDIYFATFRIPDLIYNIFVFGALSAGFMPVFAKWILLGKEKAWEFVSTLIIFFAALMGISALLVFIFAHQLAHLLVPGFDIAAKAKVAQLLRILMLQPILLAVSNVIANTLQSFRRFLAYSLAPTMYGAGTIVGVVWFAKYWGINGVMWGVVLGAVLHLLIQLPTLFSLDFRFSLKFHEALTSLLEMGKLMLPRSLALMVGQLNLFFVTIIASELPRGTLAVFNFANDLQGLPQALFAVTFATAAFPALSQLWAGNNQESFRVLTRKTLAEIFLWLIPITLLLFAFRQPFVRLTLNYGRFDQEASGLVSSALALFLLALPFQGALLLLVRVFFAMGDSTAPLLIAVLTSIITVILSFVLGGRWHAAGLAGAVMIASIVQTTILFIVLKRRLGGIDGKPLLSVAMRSLAIGGSAALLGWLTFYGTSFFIKETTITKLLLRLTISSLPIALVFFIGVLMFKLLDLKNFE